MELRGLGAISNDLEKLGVRLLAVSVDPPERSREIVKRLKLPFPILSDKNTRLTQEMGLLHKSGGPGGVDIAIPAHVLIGTDRRIRWKYVSKRIHDRLAANEVLEHVRSALANESL